MRLIKTFLFFFFAFASVSVVAQESRYIEFWTKTDAEFADPETSPLKKEDVSGFDSIARYPYNPDFAIKAKFEALERQKPITFQTTGSIKQRYQKAGELHFQVDSTKLVLAAYRNLELMRMPGYENQLFVPFTDASNGFGTYEGGRYMEIEIPETDSLLIDFNLVYNPYCAYSDRYSCPIPPRENDLSVKVLAGAKSPK
ncbi:MAG TPA: DUF1684 domain-containing protein [Cryomorphaceae bacterium]|nr:DUF1684 domain-containing protein [Cryomorphaceae bacterium]